MPAVIYADGGAVAKKKATAQRGDVPAAIVLDIEGTVAPITFVTQTLFPYARSRVSAHLSSTYDTPETQEDIDLLRQLVSTLWAQVLASSSVQHLDRMVSAVLPQTQRAVMGQRLCMIWAKPLQRVCRVRRMLGAAERCPLPSFPLQAQAGKPFWRPLLVVSTCRWTRTGKQLP